MKNRTGAEASIRPAEGRRTRKSCAFRLNRELVNGGPTVWSSHFSRQIVAHLHGLCSRIQKAQARTPPHSQNDSGVGTRDATHTPTNEAFSRALQPIDRSIVHSCGPAQEAALLNTLSARRLQHVRSATVRTYATTLPRAPMSALTCRPLGSIQIMSRWNNQRASLHQTVFTKNDTLCSEHNHVHRWRHRRTSRHCCSDLLRGLCVCGNVASTACVLCHGGGLWCVRA